MRIRRSMLLAVVFFTVTACAEPSTQSASSEPQPTGGYIADAATAEREARAFAAEYGRVVGSRPCRTFTAAQVRELEEATRAPGAPIAESVPKPPDTLPVWVCDVETVNGNARAVFAAAPSRSIGQALYTGPFADAELPAD